jgi:hypothetical protein
MTELLKISNIIFNYLINIKMILNCDENKLYLSLNDKQKEIIKININKRYNILFSLKIIKPILKKEFLNNFEIHDLFSIDFIFNLTKELIIFIDYTFDTFLEEISNNLSKYNNINKLYNIYISNISNEYLKDYTFLIYGCPLSKDIDIAIIVSKDINIDLINIDIKELYSKLEKIPNIDITKKIDINIISIENKKVKQTKKGSIEVLQGILYYTQHFYTPIENQIELLPPEPYNINNRIKPVFVYIMENLNILISKKNADILRNEKQKAFYGDELDKKIFIIDNKIFNLILENMINYNNSIINYKNYIKALLVKMLTVIFIHNNLSNTIKYYTKEGLAELTKELYFEKENIDNYALYFLFRGEKGEYNIDFYKFIIINFLEIVNIYFDSINFNWIEKKINISNPINHLNIDMQIEFWKSPIEPNEHIKKILSDLYKNKKYNNLKPSEFLSAIFPIPCDTISFENSRTCITSCTLKDIDQHPELIKSSILVTQRSDEWFELRKKFLPIGGLKNKDYNSSDNWITELYHLYVGSIGEQYVMYNVNWGECFPSYKFVNIGLLIKDNQSISPDGLLINDITKDIIPIEIKCLRIEKNIYSQACLREIKQAKLQLQQIKKIIPRITKGLICFLYIFEKNDINIKFEYCSIDL